MVAPKRSSADARLGSIRSKPRCRVMLTRRQLQETHQVRQLLDFRGHDGVLGHVRLAGGRRIVPSQTRCVAYLGMACRSRSPNRLPRRVKPTRHSSVNDEPKASPATRIGERSQVPAVRQCSTISGRSSWTPSAIVRQAAPAAAPRAAFVGRWSVSCRAIGTGVRPRAHADVPRNARAH